MLEANTSRRHSHAVRILARATDALERRRQRQAARRALRRIAAQYGTAR